MRTTSSVISESVRISTTQKQTMYRRTHRVLGVLLVIYAVASGIHFVHNAEFLAAYPGMPPSWSRMDIYLAWIAMTAVGFVGWVLLARGRPRTGLLFLAVYAALGLDSLGHYVLAPFAEHSFAMNWTILLEVTAAALVFIEVARQTIGRVARGSVS